MIRFMKKNILLLFIIFLNVAVYSKSNDLIPDWILNFNKEFPDTVYFAQKGTGKKKDLAKLEAMANLSYYFETSVVANRESNFKSLETSNGKRVKIKTEQEVLRETQMVTNTSLSAVEFTEPFYIKKEKLWHCVAYIERKTIWEKYEPTLRVSKDNFISFYNKFKETNSNIEKIKFLGMAKENGWDFIDKISYAQFLSDSLTNQYYVDDISLFSSLDSIKQSIINDTILYLTVSNDVSNQVYSSISSIISSMGFVVSKNKSISKCIVNANVLFNEYKDDDIFVYTPSINISFEEKNITTYSYSKDVPSVKSYTSDVGKKKSIHALCSIINQSFYDEFNSVLSRNK